MPSGKPTKARYQLEYINFKTKDPSKKWLKHSMHKDLYSIAEETGLSYHTVYNLLHNINKKSSKFYRIKKI